MIECIGEPLAGRECTGREGMGREVVGREGIGKEVAFEDMVVETNGALGLGGRGVGFGVLWIRATQDHFQCIFIVLTEFRLVPHTPQE